MGSEAITQNDLKNVLDAVLPVKPSEYRKLIWTNPSPTSSFSAQTISLDLSNYDEVEIEAKQLANGSIIQLCRVGIGKQTKCLFRDGNANNFYTRTFIVSASSVQFGDAYYNATLTNTDCVPVAIYGIKYERIALPQLEVVPLQVATFQKNTSFVAGAGSVVFDTPLPEGAIIKSRCISQNPNAQWLYCGIHSVSATSTTVAYRNNFSSAFSGIMELSVFYEIAN